MESKNPEKVKIEEAEVKANEPKKLSKKKKKIASRLSVAGNNYI